MADTQASKQSSSSGVPTWLAIVIGLVILIAIGILALLYLRSSSGSSGVALDGLLPTQAAVAQVPTLTASPTGGPAGPTGTATWTPRPSSTPYLTPTFVNTAEAPVVNTRATGGVSGNYQNQIIIDSGSGAPVVVPTVTRAIPRSTQTSVAATATQAITQTKVAATATQIATEIAGTATQAAATATSAAETATPLPGIWRGDYYNNKDLQDPIVLVRNDPVQTLNNLYLLFNWGPDSPGPNVNSDNFSVRWRLNADFNNTDYLFYAFSDDGVRLFVDGGTVIDNWSDATNRVLYGTRNLSGGQHRIQTEYYESQGDARIAVGWQQVVRGAWVGEYYANNFLGEPPEYILQNDAINFNNWGSGSPSAMPDDNFSIRWFKNYDFGNAATYRFTVIVDDGVRISVDDNTILDQWQNNGLQTFTVEQQFSGTKKVTVEYVERTGNARIQLDILRLDPPTPTPVTPTSTSVPPSSTPVTPSATPVTPTATPITPTATPVTPTP
jgi:hypothetical protein